MTRRDFLKRLSLGLASVGAISSAGELLTRAKAFAAAPSLLTHEAMYYKKLDDETVQCELCPRGCTLSNGQRSFCRVREPKGGKLYTAAYGAACSAHVDPIEKKPLFHFLPGTAVFSIATAGCNFRCKCCQNWQISQIGPEDAQNIPMSPAELVAQTRRNSCPTVAYTYTEPSIFYEYMLDCAKAVRSAGLRNMYHSNGYLNRKPVEELSAYLDAADVDLKGFTDDFYAQMSAGSLSPVLATLKTLKNRGVWLEITNLVVPTMNDDLGKVKEMCGWIVQNLGPDVPLHVSRFWPQYKLTQLAPTPVETLEGVRTTALAEGLHYVYIGNVPGHPAEHTYCPKCKATVIQRSGYTILKNGLVDGACKACGERIAGIWS